MAFIPMDVFLWLAVMSALVGTVLGIGATTEAWSWETVWAHVGSLAGLFAFSVMSLAEPMSLYLIAPVSALCVGAGLAVSYGTLFLRESTVPELSPATSPGGKLEHVDWADRLRPRGGEWLLTVSLLVPGVGLAYFGLQHVVSLAPLVLGGVSLMGPALAAYRLTRRQRTAKALMEDAFLDRTVEGKGLRPAAR